MEIWKKIPKFEDYEISSLSRVRNAKGKIMKQWWSGIDGNKYLVIKLFYPKERRTDTQQSKLLKIHRLILMAFIGMPLVGQIGCHKNDDPSDNSLENLYWGTPRENMLDALRNCRLEVPKAQKGEDSINCTIPFSIVEKIRDEYTGKWGEQIKLAKKYEIGPQYVSRILNNQVRMEI